MILKDKEDNYLIRLNIMISFIYYGTVQYMYICTLYRECKDYCWDYKVLYIGHLYYLIV